MGYSAGIGPGPGATVPNNTMASMMLADQGLGRASAAEDLFSGVYTEAPSRISSCVPMPPGGCMTGMRPTAHNHAKYCCY